MGVSFFVDKYNGRRIMLSNIRKENCTMVNIFVEDYDLTAEYLREPLKKHIRPGMKAAVAAFSFRENQVANAAEWDALYSRERGRYYGGIVQPLLAYGIAEDDVRFINYFADTRETAAEAVRNADIIYLPGGLMDRMVERIDEFGLREILRAHDGVILGYSAGALVQLGEYHVSPDDDYPQFGYYAGLGLLDGFYLEVHYEANPVQEACIRRVLQERKKPVYATAEGNAAIIIADGRMQLLGDVRRFEP